MSDPAASQPDSPPATVPPSPRLPLWAPAMPWVTLYLIELPLLFWLWGFTLSSAGVFGLLLPLGLYLGLGALFGILGWIIEPVETHLRRQPHRTLAEHLQWHFAWAGACAWGVVGLADPLMRLLFPDQLPALWRALLVTGLSGVVGLAVALGLLRALAPKPQQVGALTLAPPRKPALLLLAVALFAMLIAAGRIAPNIAPPRPGEPQPPNVLLISLDTVNVTRLGLYGAPQDPMPTLTRLAREGASFEHAYAHVPLTGPSHANLFTGLQPQAIGVYENTRPMPLAMQPLAEVFRDAGYFTAGIPATRMMKRDYHFDQGFDWYPERSADRSVKSLQWSRLAPFRTLATVWGHRVDFARLIDDAQYSTDNALRAAAYAQHRSWFMWVHYYDPHAPYAAEASDYLEPPGLGTEFDPELGSIANLLNLSYRGLEGMLGPCYLNQQSAIPLHADPQEIEDLRRTYDAQLAYTDRHLARLLEGLKAAGELENTLVVLCADHGEGLFDRGYFGHNYFLHEDEVRVPLLFWWPGKIAPKRIEAPAALSDVAPTLWQILKLAPPRAFTNAKPEWQGHALAAWMATPEPPVAYGPIYLQQFNFSRALVTPERDKLLYQAVMNDTQFAVNPYTGRKYEWYDLAGDARETQNLAGEDVTQLGPPLDATINRLQARLDELARAIDGVPVDSINYRGYLERAISEEQKRELMKLGYFTGVGEAEVRDPAECARPDQYTDYLQVMQQVMPLTVPEPTPAPEPPTEAAHE